MRPKPYKSGRMYDERKEYIQEGSSKAKKNSVARLLEEKGEKIKTFSSVNSTFCKIFHLDLKSQRAIEREEDMGHGEEDKSKGVASEEGNQHHQYGTFQGVSNYPPPPVTGFPQPSAPPGVYDSSSPYYAHGYQTVPVYGGVAEGRPVHVRERRLPCCGIGLGWFLFIVGFFLGALPWYIGLFIMMFGKRMDHREKPGYIACTIAAILATIAVILGVSKGAEDW